jgi:hypothetical protein
LILSLLFAVVPAYGQTNMNFDKLLIDTDKMVVVQPPEGTTWVLTAGSLALERAVPRASITVWTESPPYAPYRDPRTGEMLGCARCVTLIRVDAGRHTFVPIIGGYSETLRGQGRPITIAYPHRLMIAVSPPHGGLDQPLQTWVRFTINEKPSR